MLRAEDVVDGGHQFGRRVLGSAVAHEPLTEGLHQAIGILSSAVEHPVHEALQSGSSREYHRGDDGRRQNLADLRRRQHTWSQEAYLKASNAEGGDYSGFNDGDRFGSSVAVSGDTLSLIHI